MFFPLTAAAATARGFQWHDSPAPPADTAPVAPPELSETDQLLLSKTYRCRESGKDFRLQRRELQYYRDHRIVPPDCAPMERMRRRLGFYQYRELGRQTCSRCGSALPSVYGEDSREILCETCYQAEVH